MAEKRDRKVTLFVVPFAQFMLIDSHAVFIAVSIVRLSLAPVSRLDRGTVHKKEFAFLCLHMT